MENYTVGDIIKSIESVDYFIIEYDFLKKFSPEKHIKDLTVEDYPSLAWFLYYYTKYIIGERWDVAENIIKDDPHVMLAYASDVMKERWLDAEPILYDELFFAFLYARDVVKGDWGPAKKLCMTHTPYMVFYATEVMDKRWQEVEPLIKKDAFYKMQYECYFNCKI